MNGACGAFDVMDDDVVEQDENEAVDAVVVLLQACCINTASDLEDCKRFSQYSVPIGWAREAAKLLVIKYV